MDFRLQILNKFNDLRDFELILRVFDEGLIQVLQIVLMATLVFLGEFLWNIIFSLLGGSLFSWLLRHLLHLPQPFLQFVHLRQEILLDIAVDHLLEDMTNNRVQMVGKFVRHFGSLQPLHNTRYGIRIVIFPGFEFFAEFLKAFLANYLWNHRL